MSNQQLVKYYENNNLGLYGLQTFLNKLYLTWGGFFFKHPVVNKSLTNSSVFSMAFEIHKSPQKLSHVFLKFQNCGFKAFTLKEF